MFKLLSVAIAIGFSSVNGQKPVKFPYSPKPVELPCDYNPFVQCWTEWFDRDNPSGTGDWENLYNLRKENPGKICPIPMQIEALTLSGLTPGQAGNVIDKKDIVNGFVCLNSQQLKRNGCSDYKVRFSCHPPFCGGVSTPFDAVCLTGWYDRDDPSGSGDWELLSDLRSENPGQICESPLYIEAVTTDTSTAAVSTGEDIFIYSSTQGFVCRNEDQEDGTCRDYKVRFGCPC